MKSENRKIEVGMLLVAISIFAFLGVYFYAGSNSQGSNMVARADQTYVLADPVFAEGTNVTFLEEEAGMTIYVNVGQPLDLSVARTVYKTMEKETPEYIVGSLSLPDLPDSEDVHCFVHEEGWIAVYYLKAEPIGKIIDWNYWSGSELTQNKLEVGLEKMGNALGASVTSAKYYHFQYPYANKCMIIIETQVGAGEDTFNVKIPLEFTVYERSWSHYSEYSYDTHPSHFKIDENFINSIYETSPQTKYEQLTAAELSKNVFHTVSISGDYSTRLYGVCIALAYQEP